MGLLFWAGFGAVVGYLAAQHRGFSLATGVVAGLVLGPLAVGLFFVPGTASRTLPSHKCPYCASRVASNTRVCIHCGAIFGSGRG